MTGHGAVRTARTWHRWLLAVILVIASAAGSLAGCRGSAGRDTVSVMALWTGGEEAAFREVLDRFERTTGITVHYTGGRDTPAAIDQAVTRGTPPDVAVLPGPADFARYVQRGKLKPLDSVLGPRHLSAQYPASWLEIMKAGADRPYTVVVKASLKSLIWYNPRVFQARGYAPPRTWEQLEALTRAATVDGTPAWCLGLESASDSGWPGTDWIEDILLHESGPDDYQAWTDGDLAWTSLQVRSAWQRWGRLITARGAINGGARSAMITNFGDAGAPMFQATPGCLMDHQASFIAARYITRTTAGGTAVRGGRDFDVFAFPSIDNRHTSALEVSADLAGTFTGTSEAQTLIAYLASPEAQQIWPGQPGSGALSASTAVPLSAYPDPVAATMAGMITGRSAAGAPAMTPPLVFDASDLMPPQVKAAFQQAVLEYVAHPQKLDALLRGLDQIRLRAHTPGFTPQ